MQALFLMSENGELFEVEAAVGEDADNAEFHVVQNEIEVWVISTVIIFSLL